MRFKKMHIGLMVIAFSLVLGSALNTLPEVKAGTGLQYHYGFESGYYTGTAWNTTYGSSPVTNINNQKWNNLDGWGEDELIEVSGTGQNPALVTPPGTGSRVGSKSFSLIDAKGNPPTNRPISYPSAGTKDHTNDISDRVQFSLIPEGEPGFTQGNEFYLGFSVMIPKYDDNYLADPFDSNSGDQWIQLFTMHTRPGNSAFVIAVAVNGVSNNNVQLKAQSYTLTCLDGDQCPHTDGDWKWFKDSNNNYVPMERGVWYDFLIQAKMGSYIYVKMKRKDESWKVGSNNYAHDVYSYSGKIGFDDSKVDTSQVSYLPKITLYRDKYVSSGNYRSRTHTMYIDEVRVGTDGGGWPAAVVVP